MQVARFAVDNKGFIFFLGGVLFLSISNTLTDWGGDKIAFIFYMLSFCVISILTKPKLSLMHLSVWFVSLFFIVLFLFSSFFSFDELFYGRADFWLFLFYLIVSSMIFIWAENRKELIIGSFIFGVGLYLVFGILAWGYSITSGQIFFVQPLYGKGLSNIYGALSFATTQQVFASFAAMLAVVLFLLREHDYRIRFWGLLLGICFVSILISLNRVWILFLVLSGLYFLGRAALIAVFAIVMAVIGLFVYYSDVMFALGTVQSRLAMMELEYDFFINQDLLRVLLGRPFYTGYYFYMHERYFYYLESGPFFILINFGILGFVVVYTFFFWVSLAIFRVSGVLGFFSFYYLFFVQFMTQEFLSISFWLYWLLVGALCYLIKGSNGYLAKKL